MTSDNSSDEEYEDEELLQHALTRFLQSSCIKSGPAIMYCLDDELHALFLYYFLHSPDVHQPFGGSSTAPDSLTSSVSLAATRACYVSGSWYTRTLMASSIAAAHLPQPTIRRRALVFYCGGWVDRLVLFGISISASKVVEKVTGKRFEKDKAMQVVLKQLCADKSKFGVRVPRFVARWGNLIKEVESEVMEHAEEVVSDIVEDMATWPSNNIAFGYSTESDCSDTEDAGRCQYSGGCENLVQGMELHCETHGGESEASNTPKKKSRAIVLEFDADGFAKLPNRAPRDGRSKPMRAIVLNIMQNVQQVEVEKYEQLKSKIAAHSGGKICSYSDDCVNKCLSESDMCAAHGGGKQGEISDNRGDARKMLQTKAAPGDANRDANTSDEGLMQWITTYQRSLKTLQERTNTDSDCVSFCNTFRGGNDVKIKHRKSRKVKTSGGAITTELNKKNKGANDDSDSDSDDSSENINGSIKHDAAGILFDEQTLSQVAASSRGKKQKPGIGDVRTDGVGSVKLGTLKSGTNGVVDRTGTSGSVSTTKDTFKAGVVGKRLRKRSQTKLIHEPCRVPGKIAFWFGWPVPESMRGDDVLALVNMWAYKDSRRHLFHYPNVLNAANKANGMKKWSRHVLRMSGVDSTQVTRSSTLHSSINTTGVGAVTNLIASEVIQFIIKLLSHVLLYRLCRSRHFTTTPIQTNETDKRMVEGIEQAKPSNGLDDDGGITAALEDTWVAALLVAQQLGVDIQSFRAGVVHRIESLREVDSNVAPSVTGVGTCNIGHMLLRVRW